MLTIEVKTPGSGPEKSFPVSLVDEEHPGFYRAEFEADLHGDAVFLKVSILWFETTVYRRSASSTYSESAARPLVLRRPFDLLDHGKLGKVHSHTFKVVSLSNFGLIFGGHFATQRFHDVFFPAQLLNCVRETFLRVTMRTLAKG
jgi:hypothetical protein